MGQKDVCAHCSSLQQAAIISGYEGANVRIMRDGIGSETKDVVMTRFKN